MVSKKVTKLLIKVTELVSYIIRTNMCTLLAKGKNLNKKVGLTA